MKKLLIILILLLTALSTPLLAQQEFQRNEIMGSDTIDFWCRTPINYDRAHPPAIIVWWHGYGADSHELRDGTDFEQFADIYGWVTASFRGPYDGKHYQCRAGQRQGEMLLDWVMSVAPFSMDSIYMGGSSMGAAGGLVWHNNHCGIHDYMPAAVFAGSPILDCELRQTQYVRWGHTLDAMRAVFGGWPANPNGFPWDNDSIRHEYHRASAVRLAGDSSEIMDYADTLESMHYNALHLAVLNTWGTSDDSAYNAEWYAYGRPSQELDTLRRIDGADTTVTLCSGINGHGYPVLAQDSIVRWLSGFSANRFPLNISINADEDDEYYWTYATLDTQRYTMGRYGVKRDFDGRRLDITLVRNVSSLCVEFEFPWPVFDSLVGTWTNFDSSRVPHSVILFSNVPSVAAVYGPDGRAFPYTWAEDTLRITHDLNGAYKVVFGPLASRNPSSALPTWKLVGAYPNPFNSQVVLEVECPRMAHQEFKLYDITGRLAKTVTATLKPGLQRVTLSSDGLASGVFFVTMAGSKQAPLKVILLK